MPQRTIRFSETTTKQIEQAVEQAGFSSPTAFIRHAVQQQLAGRGERDGDNGAEERLGANLEQLRREVVRLGRAQQALFAYLDTLGKTILTCIPEPPTDARPQAVARAKERYDRMLKSVAKAMAGDAQTAIQDLAAHVE
jgi:Arc/MetJ-type ribon-helix-helix transcriptional regulator